LLGGSLRGGLRHILRKGERLEINVCSPKHDWLHIDAPAKVARDGKIFVDGKMITLEEFKDSLRRQALKLSQFLSSILTLIFAEPLFWSTKF